MSRPNQSSESESEYCVHKPRWLLTIDNLARNEIESGLNPRSVHRSSTVFPQGLFGTARKRTVERLREWGARAAELEGAR